MCRIRRAGLGGAVLAFCLLATMAIAAEVSTEREQYVAKLEPICKRNALANRRIFKGVRQEVRAGELKQASKRFLRAARAFGQTVGKLAAVPRPVADVERLEKWFGLLGNEKEILEKIGRALAAEQRHRATSYSIDLSRNSTKANNLVFAFRFNYCQIEPSRFE